MTIVVGVTGGIAAYKTVSLVRGFVLAGHDVHVVPTEAALRFVGTPTWEAVSRNPVTADLYDGVDEVRHVALGQKADLIVIAPATANTIAKLAHGIADDLLTNTVLASKAPVVIAPAMHTGMWQAPATQANVRTLRERGVVVVGPASGQLTGSDSGPGRMEEPDDIARAALTHVLGQAPATQGSAAPASAARSRRARVDSASAGTRLDLDGLRVVVTAGGTREPFDPVRFMGNRSSGKQGMAIAAAAAARGAVVTLIAANVGTDAVPDGIAVESVSTTLELEKAVTDAAGDADVVIMAAAVADYRPAQVQQGKIKKEHTGDRLTVEFVVNPDILAELSAARPEGQLVIGFAAETEKDPATLLELGRSKIARKGCDFLVVNNVGWNHGFATDDNDVIVLNRAGDIVMEASGTKLSVADRILDATLSRVP
ncbi:bifunctional phosphopantothenoylcysteine decarboxylase/phosphopantothenate synthase [Gryllotalpicola protaetiae]|uniref:Coenzyme A biosynthesis bifunctional protein CoaBC n=1 Tax=Gryllotalpicola protaetiae TaxID=2419771 RepID=A0A387BTT6_9MICO|nr:bifunctional phosphopantothenoylcysteine decarboxylase/phosphopantothenate synthase [Gryllotalpicola protaetiae]AYG05494.1 bifunctional phosphopantothenoylcysteine decarboxylase/phosphopantothenate synthase [Gryllotalpicola protaetiae]